MPQISEIVKQEQLRETLDQCRKATLYREGGFLRAYEWSAWLFVNFVSQFKVSNRKIKDIDCPVAMIGFPPQSLEKFTPEGAQTLPHEDGSVSVTFGRWLPRRFQPLLRGLQRLLLFVVALHPQAPTTRATLDTSTSIRASSTGTTTPVTPVGRVALFGVGKHLVF